MQCYPENLLQVTKKHNEDCKKLLRLMGVPVIEAPSEAEAQCAALCKSGKVYAVASEDMDSLTFGAPRFLHHLIDPSSKKVPVMEFKVSKVLEELNLTMDQFIDLCILSGCVYCDSIRVLKQQNKTSNTHLNKRNYLLFLKHGEMITKRFIIGGEGGSRAEVKRDHVSSDPLLEEAFKIHWPYL
ncbi:Flap endonuclease 1 [Camellia lanceoleosa]|uniref:Flap endonuclease 1 n=1 Tax=Camellia lanceoleosa TaxID=1840588 RepID=A0ACC0F4Y9_9ERIC|nr:Flap endonuclease 1 [Camellia lanceoleosa]